MRPILFGWIAPAVAVAFLASAAPAQTQSVSLAILPSTIAVSPSYSEVEARVELRNGSTPIRQLELSAFNNDGLTIAIGKPSTSGAEPGQSVVWIIKIKDPAHARLPASAQFELKYRRMNEPTCFRAFGSLAVTSQSDSKTLDASIEGNFDSISQERPGEGALLLTNNLDLPVAIEIKGWPGSASMTIDPIEKFEIAPRSTVRTAVKVKAQGRVTPGAYPAEFEVTGTWKWAGRTETRHLLVSKQATIGVFFESDLLKALGIPSFLVLPGCLMVFTMQLLLAFNVLGAKNESKLPDLSITTPGFWILSITYSAFYALVYAAWIKNDYLIRYGPEDLILVWLSSIVIGALLYLSIASVAKITRRLKVPTAADDQIAILKKMARNGLGVVVPRVLFTLNDRSWSGFAIEPLEDGKTLLWVAPAMLAEWGTTQAARDAQTAHNGDLNLAMNPDATEDRDAIAKRVAERLDTARQEHRAAIRWDTRGAVPMVPSPMHIKSETITLYHPPARIIT
jgi:hypothetical protein